MKAHRHQSGNKYLVLFSPDDLRRGFDLPHVLVKLVYGLLIDNFQEHFSTGKRH